MDRKLYEWQEQCLKRWFANGGRGMVQAVTGSGKTLLALTAAERLEKQTGLKPRVKIVVPTSALMRQWNRDLREFLTHFENGEKYTSNLQEEIGMRGGGDRSAFDCKYMIYVINSARYELARQILTELKRGEAVLLIADECHHYASGQNQLIFEFLPYIKEYQNHFFSLGLSATLPTGSSQHYLSSVLGRKIYHYDMVKASAGKTICPYDIYHIALSFQSEEADAYKDLSDRMSVLYRKLLHNYPSLGSLGQKERYELLRSLSGDTNRTVSEAATLYMNLSYKRKSLVALASARTSCALNLIKRLSTTEKILVFSERTSQADELYNLLQEYYPEKVGCFHSKMGSLANKNTLERFRTGNIRILITCKSIDEGIDVPDASIGIIMSGTSTRQQRVQRLGRIIRKKDIDNNASLYYLHIAETSEDSCFLPDVMNQHLFELTYISGTQKFIHPDYDRRAELLIEKMICSGSSAEKIREAERCLQLGCVRSDWLLEQNAIDEQIKKARYASEKNYWICMKKLNGGINL